ncbi:formylglycine-generating enzyme family protein [Actinomadura roseirufa]|uniref:formylglycine-generating enzyme family protein n=1 Tax=Actinomadura roseirufa TaxID=2094049 RepID=UPI00104179C7|nr:SUMF1/EgtB/PvdO family nonheme iron enzyme [Actinomadura roseirufa]
MIAVPAGTAWIGTPEASLDALAGQQQYPRSWFEDESPQHPVELAAFWIDVHPVTNAAFTAFTAATGYRTAAETRGFGLVYGAGYWQETPGACWRHPGGAGDRIDGRMDHPVVHVTHIDARAYAAWAGLRLPTEAEWEYVAHGPTWRPWPWGTGFDACRANGAEYGAVRPVRNLEDWRGWWARHFDEHGTVPATTPVTAFSPQGDSPFGVTDMAGNVAEWTATSYRLYDPRRRYDPLYHAAAGRYMVVRGGGWMHLRHQMRTSERVAVDPAYANHATGFRCAADTPRTA